jgi:uncharacterized protein YodC (DUF2158 family)
MSTISHSPGADGLKDCFREPIPEIFEAAGLLDTAVTEHLLGNTAVAEEAIRAADMPVIGEWLDSVWLGPWIPPYRAVTKVSGLPPVVAKADRFLPRDAPSAMKRALVERDGHHCRLCGIPLVRAEIRKKLTVLYPEAARWTGIGTADQHRGLQVMWLQYDHVLVHSRGGETSMENIVVTCPGCNFGRDRFTLEEVGLRDPRVHIRTPSWDGWQTWQGLERILPSGEKFLSAGSDCKPKPEKQLNVNHFKVGDLVQLRSGGQQMVVACVSSSENADQIEVAWFEGTGQMRREWLPKQALATTTDNLSPHKN